MNAATTAQPSAAPHAKEEAAWRKTRRRVLTRRGVLWLGQTCNQRCYFCYFLNRIANARHPEHPFMDLDKAKDICRTLREYYGNTSIDIQGGEPTIHPEIFALTQYCHDIGLYPTLITNGLRLAEPGELERYQGAGLRDFLVSLHGIGEIHDQVVGMPDAYARITRAIEGMATLGIPFRFNCTMSKPVVPCIPIVAQKAIEYGARAVNYIAFNPFEDQAAGIRTHENVPRYLELKPYLTEAIDRLEEAGIEVNVRYLPLCIAEPRHRKNMYNFQQLPYDLHEWDYQSWMWSGMQPQRMRDGGLTPPYRIGLYARRVYHSNAIALRNHYAQRPLKRFIKFGTQRFLACAAQAFVGKEKLYRQEAILRACQDGQYQRNEACEHCAARAICDAFHGDYAGIFGTDEAAAISGDRPIDDPLHYIRDQAKGVETEEQAWAL